jgi:hypothetical protein
MFFFACCGVAAVFFSTWCAWLNVEWAFLCLWKHVDNSKNTQEKNVPDGFLKVTNLDQKPKSHLKPILCKQANTMKQVLITPSAGKLLIAKALSKHPTIQSALKDGTLVLVAGTTNGYLAQEILLNLGIKDFSRNHFFRGVTLPPNIPTSPEGRLKDESHFPGDVIISKGIWQKGKTLADVADSLKMGDCIVKGANALDLEHKQAAILIGHSKAGTAGLSIPAVFGRRVKLIIAVGLEKRIGENLNLLAEKLASPDASGYRLLPIAGEVFTELDAIKMLSGATAEIIAAGGVCGAEGACYLAVEGTKKQEEEAEKIVSEIQNEPQFKMA